MLGGVGEEPDKLQGDPGNMIWRRCRLDGNEFVCFKPQFYTLGAQSWLRVQTIL